MKQQEIVPCQDLAQKKQT